MTPSVSVLLPVFNGEKFLRQAIDSMLAQTFRDFELLVLNDGSTDGTVDIVKGYKDARVRLLDSPNNIGLVSQLNKGLENAGGKYIARMDADDIAMPDRFAKQYAFMENNQDVGLCGCFTVVFNQQKQFFKTLLPRTHGEISAFMLFASPFFHPTIMIRRSVLSENNIRYVEGTSSTEDYFLYTDLQPLTKLANVPFVGLRYRMHLTNMSVTHAQFQQATGERRRREYVASFFGTDEQISRQGGVDNHMAVYTARITSISDFHVMMNWMQQLCRLNRRNGFAAPGEFTTGCSHFVYRKLIRDGWTSLRVLWQLVTTYRELFLSLPLMYQILMTARCISSPMARTKRETGTIKGQ